MAGAIDCDHGPLRAVAMFQRQLRCVQPFAFRLWPPQDNRSALRHGPRQIPDAFGGDSLDCGRNPGWSSSGRCASRSRHGSGFDGVGHGMVRRVPLVLDCGEASIDADRNRAGDSRLPVSFSDESSARVPRALFARRMDRLRHLDWSRVRPASSELERKVIRETLGFSSDDGENSFQMRAAFERKRALVYTFEGETLRHR